MRSGIFISAFVDFSFDCLGPLFRPPSGTTLPITSLTKMNSSPELIEARRPTEKVKGSLYILGESTATCALDTNAAALRRLLTLVVFNRRNNDLTQFINSQKNSRIHFDKPIELLTAKGLRNPTAIGNDQKMNSAKDKNRTDDRIFPTLKLFPFDGLSPWCP